MPINLNDYKLNITSRKGENGIILRLLYNLKIPQGYGVEVGASDGIQHSNLNPLIKRGWNILFIENDVQKYENLIKNMMGKKKVTCLNASIRPDSFNMILGQSGFPQDFDILSLDIDGIDYWVFKDLIYSPKIAIVEYNSDLEGSVTVPREGEKHSEAFFGCSIEALAKLGISKGYDIVGITRDNLIFLKHELNNGMFELQDVSVNHFTPQGRLLSDEDKMRFVIV